MHHYEYTYTKPHFRVYLHDKPWSYFHESLLGNKAADDRMLENNIYSSSQKQCIGRIKSKTFFACTVDAFPFDSGSKSVLGLPNCIRVYIMLDPDLAINYIYYDKSCCFCGSNRKCKANFTLTTDVNNSNKNKHIYTTASYNDYLTKLRVFRCPDLHDRKFKTSFLYWSTPIWFFVCRFIVQPQSCPYGLGLLDWRFPNFCVQVLCMFTFVVRLFLHLMLSSSRWNVWRSRRTSAALQNYDNSLWWGSYDHHKK